MVKKLQLDESKLKKLQELKELKINPYPYSFKQSDHAQDLKHKYAHLGIGDHTKDLVSVAGRVMLKRVMGKASFMQILDQTGVIQLYLAQDILGEKNYDILIKKTDNGDILGVEGIIFKTKTGEITVEVKSGEMLCKSLLPMPEKFHGLKDIELKYRQRYVDLFVNPETKEVFFKRSKIIQTVREYLTERGFLEVETPVLQTIYGGANAKPFITHINAWDMKMFLSISPELYLKRILVGGIERVFTICKNFRNEDVDPTHNPEFTMMECYQSYVDYEQTMQYVEEMYEKACIAANGSTQIKRVYKGEEVIVDFKAPWKRITMLDALKKYAKIDASKMTEEHVLNLVEENKIEYEGEFSWGKGVQLLFEELVEDKLVQPVHITDHPRESTPLCKAHRKDPRLIERFESYCLGVELSNGYSELNDPILQRELLEAQAKELRAGASEAHPMDEDFVNAMEYGMPPASGVGVGIDRMVIMLTGVDSIRDIIFFPTMKPVVEENEKKEGYNKSINNKLTYIQKYVNNKLL